MRTAAYSITAVSVVNRPEKASQNRTIVKIGIELQSVDSPRQSQRIRLHRPSCPAALQKDYPGIEYEMLLGDYDEVEQWIDEGRVDCGFLRLPTRPKFDTILLKQDEYKVVLPVGHPLAQQEAVYIRALNALPFLLLEHGGKAEVSDLLEQSQVRPDIRFTTWEDFAIMAMVERGMGVGILPDMILRRISYRLEIRPLKEPYYRSIGLAMKHAAHLTPAARKFIDYLPFREADRS